MPSSTFLNLPAEKQEKLLEAATREFSHRPFNEASINQIIKEAGIPRGSFYMYFQDKEDLFRYLLKGYVDQLFMLLEEFLLRNGGDIFQALLDLYDYVQAKIDNQHLGEIGAMTGIIRCNSGMQKNGLLEMLDAETLLQRLGGAVNPDLLDLRQDRDLGDILGTLLVVAAPMIYTGLQAGGDPGTRDRLENILNIFKRGMGKILIILVVVIAIVAGCVSRLTKNVNTQLSSSYLVSTVTRQDLTVSVSGTATLQPADSYNVTTLLSGDIVSAPFEEGDLVTKDTLLYTMDSSDAQDSMDRAQISVQQAQMSYQQAQEALHPTAPISGTVSEIYVHNGESVTAGTQLAKIVASTELSIDFLFPFASPSDFYVGQAATVFVDGYAGSQMGTVTYVSNSTTITSNGKEAVSVRVRLNNPGTVSDAVTASAIIGSYSSYGQAPVSMPASSVVYASGSGTVNDFSKLAGSTVTKGEVLCTVESETIRDQIESARLNLQSAQLSASTASGAVDDYNIKSPIAGTVIEKNFKAGDKVDGASSGTLAVIYDLSYLELEMAVDELDIGKVEVGQEVRITADALEGQTFSGVVDKVSINGTTANGATSYPVTIIIEDYGDLRPGMNVSAQIIGEVVPNALCIPVDAVERGNTVTVPGPGALSEDGLSVVDVTKLETKEVTLGRNDDEYIEVTDGLEEGDVVLISNQASSLMDMMMGG